MSNPTRIVIVCGGIAGILLATRLGNHFAHSHEARVTLIDSSTHIWKPMLHTVAAGTRDMKQQQVSYLAHASAHRFAWQPGEMCGLDRQRKEVLLSELRTPEGDLVLEARMVAYDVLVLSLGSRANDFGVPGVRQHCHSSTARSRPRLSTAYCARACCARWCETKDCAWPLSGPAPPVSNWPPN